MGDTTTNRGYRIPSSTDGAASLTDNWRNLGEDIDADVQDVLDSLFGATTSYTPSWTSSGTAPSLGNGTLVGKYIQLGKLVVFSLQLSIGSSTTIGTGVYTLSLPVTSAAGNQQIVTAKCRDSSATSAGHFPAIGEIPPSTTQINFFNVNQQVSSSVPFTWANGDYLACGGLYFAA